MALIDKNIQILMLKGEKGDPGVTGDYSGIANKPKINSVELSGNKSPSDLGLASETDLASIQTNFNTINNNIGILTDLNTTDQTSVVNAINEVNSKVIPVTQGGTGSTDFFEQGSWTPTINAPGVSYYYQYGSYQRIGDLVYVVCSLKFDITNAGSESATIGGLPFVALNTGVIYGMSLVQEYDACTYPGAIRGQIYGGGQSISVQRDSGALANTWKTGTNQYIAFNGLYLRGN